MTKNVDISEGVRIHKVRVSVVLNCPWKKAVNAAGPDTPDHYTVRNVGGLYLLTGTGEKVERNLVLLNYPAGNGSWDKALAWASGKGLKKTVPREVFAVGEKYPKLHKVLRINPMFVVAVTECLFDGRRQACCVWWDNIFRVADLVRVNGYGSADDWFAFCE